MLTIQFSHICVCVSVQSTISMIIIVIRYNSDQCETVRQVKLESAVNLQHKLVDKNKHTEYMNSNLLCYSILLMMVIELLGVCWLFPAEDMTELQFFYNHS